MNEYQRLKKAQSDLKSGEILAISKKVEIVLGKSVKWENIKTVENDLKMKGIILEIDFPDSPKARYNAVKLDKDLDAYLEQLEISEPLEDLVGGTFDSSGATDNRRCTCGYIPTDDEWIWDWAAMGYRFKCDCGLVWDIFVGSWSVEKTEGINLG